MAFTPKELEHFVAGLARSPERWRHLVRHADDVRVFGQIWDDDDVNAWVICWSHDQDTGFHDHDESAAAIAVISGEVREERLRIGDVPSVRIARSGSAFTVPAVSIHRVLHSGDRPAVTIHAYSPPLVRTGAYRTGPGGQLEREVVTLQQELRAAPVLS